MSLVPLHNFSFPFAMVVVLNIFQMYLTIQVVIINYNMVLVLIFWLMLEIINFCTISVTEG